MSAARSVWRTTGRALYGMMTTARVKLPSGHSAHCSPGAGLKVDRVAASGSGVASVLSAPSGASQGSARSGGMTNISRGMHLAKTNFMEMVECHSKYCPFWIIGSGGGGSGAAPASAPAPAPSAGGSSPSTLSSLANPARLALILRLASLGEAAGAASSSAPTSGRAGTICSLALSDTVPSNSGLKETQARPKCCTVGD